MNLLEVAQTSKNTQIKSVALVKNQTPKVEYKPDILDIFSEKVVNKQDLTDMVSVPRTIFKGYLCFTAGTTMSSIASLTKNNKIANGLSILGNLISIYGTYNFVKPFLIRGKDLTKSEK